MPPGFTFEDLQHILLIKLFLALFLIIGLIFIIKKIKTIWLFLLLGGLLSALSYFVFVDDLGLMFWGLKGDEITIAAMFEVFAHGSFMSDFAYAHLPPFYPPLFFWFFSIFGKIFNWNGIVMAKFSSFVSILILPISTYFIQSWYWGKDKLQINEEIPGKLAWFLFPVLIWIVVDWDAMIMKPYQIIAGVATVLWTGFLFFDLQIKRCSWKRVIVYGLTGALIFMTYYLWLFFAAIAAGILGLFIVKGIGRGYYYSRLTAIGFLSILISTPYLVPLVLSYREYGSENWQIILLTNVGISYTIPMIKYISWRGLTLLLGFISILIFWENKYIKVLLSLFVSTYIWQFTGIFTVLFFASPIQEFKGFDFFDKIILCAGLAFGLEKLWSYCTKKYSYISWKKPVQIVGLLILSTYMFFGFFIDDPVVQARRIESRGVRNTVFELMHYLNNSSFVSNDTLIFHSGISELYAFKPINTFLYYNQHNSHPASQFSERKYFVEWISIQTSSEEFHKLITQNEFGPIEMFIFFKNEGEDYYPVYFNVDNFPNQSKDFIIHFKKDLFSEEFFVKVFENKEFVVFKTI